MKSATFEEKLELAKEYIDKLMDKEVTLEESIELYEKALVIITNAQNMLEEAKLKVEEIKKEKSGVAE
jgi:exodeoxyribonuclease VII small subunit